MGVTANELKVLRVLKELKEADPIALDSKMGITSAYADYLCRYLTKNGYLERNGRRYRLTPAGQKALEEAFTKVLSRLRAREEDVMETLAKIRLP